MALHFYPSLRRLFDEHVKGTSKYCDSSFPRKRESRKIKGLDSRLRGNDEFLERPLSLHELNSNKKPQFAAAFYNIDHENLMADQRIERKYHHSNRRLA